MNESRCLPPHSQSVSKSVVEAVAEAEGLEPAELAPPLYEVIDPDALDRLFSPTGAGERRDGTITFTYCDRVVTVSGAGAVTVAPCDG